MNPVDLRLCAIIDPERAGNRDLAHLARAAVAGGATLVLYRDKLSHTRTLVERARTLKATLRGSRVPLIVSGRVDIALAAEADGVHLGQEDLHPNDAHRLLGPRAIIGMTIGTPAQADELFRLPVDYACIDGVIAAAGHDAPFRPIGLDGLAKIVFRVRLAAPGVPVGILAVEPDRIPAVIGVGADGIAVASPLSAANDVEAAARLLRTSIDRALAIRGVVA